MLEFNLTSRTFDVTVLHVDFNVVVSRDSTLFRLCILVDSFC